ncbi:HigA family addiction module antidote protein [Pontibacter sp. Tf4]|uniref:HigA family addiction module antitoxin n=1 Tax=Pontibacter sp. Tf4 TaxID=2761620 RepID=UPI001629044C|nr:HigA family addiction module antitoxin [Pontibacter sp. Tf4]MBB6613098.1 HigA family addiction module antidote protein [Pontibacter sp. Tf4]
MLMFNPPHAGQILREYVSGTGKSVTEIALSLEISRKNLSMILNEHAGISAEMAWKLSAAFGTSPEFWLNFQKNYDLWQAKEKVDVSRIKNLLNTAA